VGGGADASADAEPQPQPAAACSSSRRRLAARAWTTLGSRARGDVERPPSLPPPLGVSPPPSEAGPGPGEPGRLRTHAGDNARPTSTDTAEDVPPVGAAPGGCLSLSDGLLLGLFKQFGGGVPFELLPVGDREEAAGGEAAGDMAPYR
jgi:hypothetical protein